MKVGRKGLEAMRALLTDRDGDNTMAVMPRVHQDALDYVASFGIDTDRIKEHVERGGYYLMDAVARWKDQFIRWPEGFDYDKFLRLAVGGALPEVGSFRDSVTQKTAEIREMLIQKNEAYGNAALDPVRVFSQASPEEQLLVRIDDKLSRLKRGHTFADEDTVKDLIGYLILLQIARDED